LSLVFASGAMAGIIDSTYNFSDSTSGATTITDTGNKSYTDPANAAFCVGPNGGSNCGGAGLYGSYTFGQTDPTDDTITFLFSGSTDETNGTFSIDLGDFVTTDGSTITGVTYGSGNLFNGDFSQVSWNGTDAVFTGTADGGYDAVGDASVVFDVAVSPASTPEPASFALFGLGLVGLSSARRRLSKSA